LDEIAADPSHPRYASLLMRHRMEVGAAKGMLADSALIAHGRGEAFDYLLGEKTHAWAERAMRHALGCLIRAKSPVLSVNGNVAALAADEMIRLANHLNCSLEVNIFYRTPERMKAIIGHLEERCEHLGLSVPILGQAPNGRIPGLEGPRAACTVEGILNSDVILVPLEDGDRCEALVNMGKTVIVVDLNPLSRSAQMGSITIVNEVVRALTLMCAWLDEDLLSLSEPTFENHRSLREATETIRSGFD